jgi:hypothetical protein
LDIIHEDDVNWEGWELSTVWLILLLLGLLSVFLLLLITLLISWLLRDKDEYQEGKEKLKKMMTRKSTAASGAGRPSVYAIEEEDLDAKTEEEMFNHEKFFVEPCFINDLPPNYAQILDDKQKQ